MTAQLPQVRSVLRNSRFDSRFVAAGLALAVTTALGGGVLAGVTQNRTEKVVAPVADLCARDTPAAAELAASGACGAADNARQVGPYIVARVGDPAPGPNAAEEPTADAPGGPPPPGEGPPVGSAERPGTGALPGMSDNPDAPGGPPPAGSADRPGSGALPGAPEPPADPVPPAEQPPAAEQPPPASPEPIAPASQTFALPDGQVFTCARTGGTDLDPMFRCEQTGSTGPDPETTTPAATP